MVEQKPSKPAGNKTHKKGIDSLACGHKLLPADELEQPSQVTTTLAEADVDSFLLDLFGAIAERPSCIPLDEALSVVLYLESIAQKGTPKTILDGGSAALKQWQLTARTREEITARDRIKRLAEVVWKEVLRNTDGKPTGHGPTWKFLNDYKCYWSRDWHAAKNDIEKLRLPPGTQEPFPKPNLIGPRSKRTGNLAPDEDGVSRRRLTDDISERIAIADWALKGLGVKRRHDKIAEVLNKTAPKPELELWDREGIRDRARKYREVHPPTQVEGMTVAAIHGFYFARMVSRNASERSSSRAALPIAVTKHTRSKRDTGARR
jgi:hypothetical protein